MQGRDSRSRLTLGFVSACAALERLLLQVGNRRQTATVRRFDIVSRKNSEGGESAIDSLHLANVNPVAVRDVEHPLFQEPCDSVRQHTTAGQGARGAVSTE